MELIPHTMFLSEHMASRSLRPPRAICCRIVLKSKSSCTYKKNSSQWPAVYFSFARWGARGTSMLHDTVWSNAKCFVGSGAASFRLCRRTNIYIITPDTTGSTTDRGTHQHGVCNCLGALVSWYRNVLKSYFEGSIWGLLWQVIESMP